jgi:hypothetical protein
VFDGSPLSQLNMTIVHVVLRLRFVELYVLSLMELYVLSLMHLYSIGIRKCKDCTARYFTEHRECCAFTYFPSGCFTYNFVHRYSALVSVLRRR